MRTLHRGIGRFSGRRSIMAGVAGLLAWAAANAYAGSPNLQVSGVANGTAAFQHAGSTTIIHASNGAIINYSQFDIPAGAAVQFVQPGSTARVLNRINSNAPSQINGSLTANGVVFLINPSGLIFGNGAAINTAGFFAAASHMSDADFLSGNNHFTGAKGVVINNGMIQVGAGGQVVLVGQSVSNAGTIVAPGGLVAFAAGDDVYVVENNNSLMLKVTGGAAAASGKAAVENTGAVHAEGGKVSMVAGDIYGLAVKNAGEVHAREIALKSNKGAGGSVVADGTLDASSSAAGTKGGTVMVLGDVSAAIGMIDVSGDAGGGIVRIGGDWHGGGTLQTASQAYVGRSAMIKADALTTGPGGDVVVWSDHQTFYYGSISAKGGPQGGAGGNAEVSGHYLDFNGPVNLQSFGGASGSLLLDPLSITIVNGAVHSATDDTVLDNGGSVHAVPGQILSDDNPGANLTISTGTLVSNLNTQDVVLGVQGLNSVITVSGTVDASGNANAHNLLLSSEAANGLGIVLNAPIILKGAATLSGRSSPNGNPTVTVNNGGLIQNGLNLVKNAGTLTIGPGTYTENILISNPVTLEASGGVVTINGSLTSTIGGTGLFLGATNPLSIKTIGGGAMTFNDALTLGQNVTLTPSGGVSFLGTITGGGKDLTVSGGGAFQTVTNVGAFTVTGTTVLNGIVSGGTSVDFNSAGGGTSLAATATAISTSGSQTYGGAVTLHAPTTTLTSSAGGTIWFKGAVEPSVATTLGLTATATAGVIKVDATAPVGGTLNFGAITLSGTKVILRADLTTNTLLGLTGSFSTVDVNNAVSLDHANRLINGAGTLVLATGTYAAVNGNPTGTVTLSHAITLDSSAGAVSVNGSILDGQGITFKTAGLGAGGAITTTGSQTYNTAAPAITLSTDTQLAGTAISIGNVTGGGNALTVGNTSAALGVVTGVTALVVNGNATFNGSVSADSINVTGTTAASGANYTTTGNQTYGNVVTVSNAGTTFASSVAGGKIWFKNSLLAAAGGQDVAVNTTGATGVDQFDAAIGSVGTPFQRVTLNAGTASIQAVNFTNTPALGTVNLVNVAAGGSLKVAADVVANSGTISLSAGTFAGPVNIAATDVTWLTTGPVVVQGALTATAGTLKLGGSFSTQGAQTYGAVQLTANTVLTSTTGGAITFGGLVDSTGGAHSLSVTTDGLKDFQADVGSVTPLSALQTASLTSPAPGSTKIWGSVTTTGAQTYGDAVIFNGAATHTFDAGAAKIWFKGTTTGSGGTLATTTTGTVEFDNTVSGFPTVTLGSLADAVLNGTITSATPTSTATFPTTVEVGGTGSVNQGVGLVAPGGVVTVAAGSYTDALVTIANTMTIHVNGGTATINGAITQTASPGSLVLGVTGGAGGFITTGVQTYLDIALDSPVTLSASSFAFNGKVQSLTGGTPESLTVNSAGTTAFNDIVGGGGKPLLNLTKLGAGSTTFGVATTAVTTTGTQSYGAATLGGDITFTGTATAFGSLVTGGGHALNIVNNGSLAGVSGASSVSITGTATLLTGTITTTLGQTYTMGVTLSGPVSLVDTGGSPIILGGAVTSGAGSSLTVTTAGPITIGGGSVTTPLFQTYNGPVTLGTTTTFTSTSGVVRFGSTVTGGGGVALNVNGSSIALSAGAINTVGNQTYNAPITGTGAITLTSGGIIAINGGSVVTAGNQTYNGAVTFSGSTVMNGAVIDFKSTVNSPAVALTINGTGAFDGNVNLLSLMINGPTLFHDPTISTTAGQTYTGAATLNADTVLTDSSSMGITFNSTINGAFALDITTTGGQVTNPGLPIGSNITLGGAVNVASLNVASGGNVIVLGNLNATGPITLRPNLTLVSAKVSGGTLVRGGPDLLSFYYAPGQLYLGANVTAGGDVLLGGNRSTVPGVATIFSNVPQVTITGANVTMGQNEKYVAAVPNSHHGSVSIFATNTASIGDITALDTILVHASTIKFDVRPASFSFLPTNVLTAQLVGGIPQVAVDASLSYVAGSAIKFQAGGFVNNSLNAVGFATANGTGGEGVPGLVRAWDLKATVTSVPLSSSDSSKGVILNALRTGSPLALTLTYLPLLSAGPSIVNPSNAIASVLPTQLPSPVAAGELSVSDIKQLADIGIKARDLDPSETDAMANRAAVFDDVPDEIHSKEVRPDTRQAALKVAVGRLPVSETLDLLHAFRQLFCDVEVDASGKPVLDPATGAPNYPLSLTKRRLIVTRLDAGWKAYKESKKEGVLSGEDFRKFLEQKAGDVNNKVEVDALAVLNQLRALYQKLDGVNLDPSVLRQARLTLFRVVSTTTGVVSTPGGPVKNQTVMEAAVGVQPVRVGMVTPK